MNIIDVSDLSKDEERKLMSLAEAQHGFVHRGNSRWTTYVIHEISSSGFVLQTEIRTMQPATELGSVRWIALPDFGTSLAVSKGPWIESKGELNYKVSAEAALRRNCPSDKTAFIGAMACLAGGCKLLKENGSEFQPADAGDVFSWAIWDTRAAKIVLGLQHRQQREDERCVHRDSFCGLLERVTAVLGVVTADKLVQTDHLSPIFTVPQYARALKALLAANRSVADSRVMFRTITGVWVQTPSQALDKQTILDAYAAIRWL